MFGKVIAENWLGIIRAVLHALKVFGNWCSTHFILGINKNPVEILKIIPTPNLNRVSQIVISLC